MTTPDEPGPTSSGPADPDAPTTPSLFERLAELEPADGDDVFFDEDDNDLYDEADGDEAGTGFGSADVPDDAPVPEPAAFEAGYGGQPAHGEQAPYLDPPAAGEAAAREAAAGEAAAGEAAAGQASYGAPDAPFDAGVAPDAPFDAGVAPDAPFDAGPGLDAADDAPVEPGSTDETFPRAVYVPPAFSDSLYAPGWAEPAEPVEPEPVEPEEASSLGWPADDEPEAPAGTDGTYEDAAPADEDNTARLPLGATVTQATSSYDVASATAVTMPAAAAPAVLPEAGAGQAAAEEPDRRRRRRRRISVPVLALLLMIALMAAATTYLWLEVREHEQTEDARRSGLEASRDAARLLFSYDYRTLEKDFSTGRALTTGAFRQEYEKTTTKVVADVAAEVKAVVKANVVSAGVVRATPDTVVTVVYVNQVTISTRVTGEKVDLSRVRMTLRRVGERWLVEAVDAL